MAHAVNFGEVIDEYMNVYNEYECSNFNSYDYCRDVFQNPKAKRDMNNLALYLFSFLANWGMFRGSSFLGYQDYKILIPICEIVLNDKYKKLNLDIFDDEFNETEYSNLINDISEQIRRNIIGKKYCKNLMLYWINSVSDTFIAKILLVVFGCVPAFDELGENGRKKLSIRGGSLNNMTRIIRFANENKELLQKKQKEIKKEFGKEYSIMKLVDMIFWTVGARIEKEKKEKENAMREANKANQENAT